MQRNIRTWEWGAHGPDKIGSQQHSVVDVHASLRWLFRIHFAPTLASRDAQAMFTQAAKCRQQVARTCQWLVSVRIRDDERTIMTRRSRLARERRWMGEANSRLVAWCNVGGVIGRATMLGSFQLHLDRRWSELRAVLEVDELTLRCLVVGER